MKQRDIYKNKQTDTVTDRVIPNYYYFLNC